MKQFLQISILVFVTASCGLKTTKALQSTAITNTEILNLYFSDSSVDYVYKAKIAVYGRNFGGIVIIKKVGVNTHRVVFTTEFGSKIFDFLFEGDQFTKNFILEDLDKKILVNTLRKDFKLLLTEKVKVEAQFASEEHIIFKSDVGNRFNFYYFTSSERHLQKIVNTSKTKEKVVVLLKPLTAENTSEEKMIADHIGINHQNIKLSITMDYFKKD